MIFGKLIGGAVGFYSGGLFTCLLGVFVGHLFDKALRRFLRDDSPEALAIIQQNFFETTFTLRQPWPGHSLDHSLVIDN